MAKSLRSKWRRKMKAEKRVRYGEKELQRLKNMLTEAGDYQMVPESSSADQPSEKIPINAVPRPKSISSQARRERSQTRKSRLDEFDDEATTPATIPSTDDVEMAGDEDAEEPEQMSAETTRVYSKRTFKDQFGNYPVWMNKRKMMTQQKKNKRIKKNRAMSVLGKKGGKRRR